MTSNNRLYRNSIIRCMTFLICVGSLLPGVASAASAAAPSITGQITGGKGRAFGVIYNLDKYGYEVNEYFLEGTATSYQPTDPGVTSLDSDGMWSITATGNTTPYRTRLLILRPKDPKDFNGTVYVEWLNVSAGFDLSPDLSYGKKELLRNGYIYVGVDAQSVGVNNPNFGLKAYDPGRYGSLNVPTNDSYSYDIFAQAGQAIRHARGVNPLSHYKIKHVIAGGESQSAARMTTYIDAVHPVINDGYDGFFVHSHAQPAPLIEKDNTKVTAPVSTKIRSDLNVPVMEAQTETDVIRALPSRQADSPKFRLWELTGTAHLDAHAEDDIHQLTDTFLPNFPNPTCKYPTDNTPERYFIDSAIFNLNRWVAQGTAPPKAPRMEVANGDYVRGSNGNVMGGLRLPQLQAPIARYSGTNNTAAPEDGPEGAFCVLYGSVKPFDKAAINDLYPTHKDYVRQFKTSVASLKKQGFLRPYDAKKAVQVAKASDIGTRTSSSDNHDDDDGGCTLVPGGPFDPSLLVLVALAVFGLRRRRRRGL